METEINIRSLSFNTLKSEPVSINKYDINIDVEEEKSTKEQTSLKYSIDLNSNPKNSVININGTAIINENQANASKFLEKDENDIPIIIHSIYKELFPLLYIITKGMKIPCPTHKLSEASLSNDQLESNTTPNSEIGAEEKPKEEKAEEKPKEEKAEEKPKEEKAEEKPKEEKVTEDLKSAENYQNSGQQ